MERLRGGGSRSYRFSWPIFPFALSLNSLDKITTKKSRRQPQGEGFTYEKHKMFLYKEDFDKFIEALQETVDHVKTELMPDVDFSQFAQRERDESDDYASSELKWE